MTSDRVLKTTKAKNKTNPKLLKKKKSFRVIPEKSD